MNGLWMFHGTRSCQPALCDPAPVGGRCVCCVYALLPNKTQETYEEKLQAILDRCDELQLMPDPSLATVNYEKAEIQALHSKLDEYMGVKGCFFHLIQNT